jgi:osmotically-inducible protein OsmY
MKNNSLKNARIGVVTNAGVVSLSGDVSTLLVSAQASWTARQITGVKAVKNDLVVVNN